MDHGLQWRIQELVVGRITPPLPYFARPFHAPCLSFPATPLTPASGSEVRSKLRIATLPGLSKGGEPMITHCLAPVHVS